GLEGDDDLIRGLAQGRVLGVGVDVLGRGVPQVLQVAGLNGAAPDVLVDGERGGLGLLDRDVVFLGEGDGLVAGPGVIAGRGDDLQLRCGVGEADLETDLVVALTGAAVGDGGAVVL